MKDEIKEILDKWKCYIGLTKKFTTKEYEMLRVEDIDKILDYITNLQEELEEEKKDFKEANDYCFELKDYKTRCDKAIPMLKDLNIKLKDILKIGIDIKEISDIESLLQGEDNE